MLVIDFLGYRGEKAESRRVTLTWSVIWVAAGVLFGVFVWNAFGARRGHEYFAAYLMEKSLSLDNVFVFLLIFQSLGVPKSSQHKTLFWGILGAVVLRALFIFAGVAALERWAWVSFIFGALLLYAAWHAWWHDPAQQKKSAIVEWLSRHLRVTKKSGTNQFLVKEDGRWVATPLLVALCAIEISDVMFAIDSVPAALSITHDRFIVYSSNIFAILGLRALYLYLAATIVGLRYLHYGLAAVLAFAGVKITTAEWIEISPLLSVGIVAAILMGAVGASLVVRRRGKS